MLYTHRLRTLGILLSIGMGIVPFSANALSFRITNLGSLTYAHDVNSSGQVTGQTSRFTGSPRAFLYDGTTMQNLGTLYGGQTSGGGINDLGYVCGGETILSGGNVASEAFFFDGTTLHGLGTLGGTYSGAAAINNAGQMTGHAATENNVEVHAFLYDGGQMIDLGAIGVPHAGYMAYSYGEDINSRGQVTGISSTTQLGHLHAFLYDDGTMIDLGTLGGMYSYGYGLNDLGQVTGYSYTENIDHRAFLYDGTTMINLGTLGGNSSYGHDINNRGQIVGRSATPDTVNSYSYHAFLYDERLGAMADLNDFIDPASGWHLFSANAINEDGLIVGQGMYQGRQTAFLLAPIPEPTSLVLLCMGIIGLAGHTRRRQRKS